jgi:hypothetical protein
MLAITIECPVTHRRVRVDILSIVQIGLRTKVGGPIKYSATVVCPSCGKTHLWRPIQTAGLAPAL